MEYFIISLINQWKNHFVLWEAMVIVFVMIGQWIVHNIGNGMIVRLRLDRLIGSGEGFNL